MTGKRPQADRLFIARANRKGEKHEYQNCKGDDRKRSACVAYKTGWREGYQIGFAEGYDAGYGAGRQAGYGEGFDAGLRSCPGPHGGG